MNLWQNINGGNERLTKSFFEERSSGWMVVVLAGFEPAYTGVKDFAFPAPFRLAIAQFEKKKEKALHIISNYSDTVHVSTHRY